MTLWVNMVTVAIARNATTTLTANPTSGNTLVTGSYFSPTSGRLLVCVFEAGAATATTPSGWTLPTSGSAVSNTGLYVWTKTAAGSDSVSTTTNSTNQAGIATFYEFAAGSTFLASASATAQSKSAGAGPTLTLSAGTKLVMAAAGEAFNSTTGSASYASWGNSAIENVDSFVVQNGTAGYAHGQAYIEDSTATSISVATTLTSTATNAVERLVFAVQAVAAAAAIPPELVMAPIQRF